MTKRERKAILVEARKAATARDHASAAELFARVGIDYHVSELN